MSRAANATSRWYGDSERVSLKVCIEDSRDWPTVTAATAAAKSPRNRPYFRRSSYVCVRIDIDIYIYIYIYIHVYIYTYIERDVYRYIYRYITFPCQSNENQIKLVTQIHEHNYETKITKTRSCCPC